MPSQSRFEVRVVIREDESYGVFHLPLNVP
jgi:hypothetical protein